MVFSIAEFKKKIKIMQSFEDLVHLTLELIV